MRQLFNSLLAAAGVATLVFIGFLFIGLGYLGGLLTLNLGIVPTLIIFAIIIVWSFFQDLAFDLITAPIWLIGRAVGLIKPAVPAEEDPDEERGNKMFSYGAGLLFVLGGLIATIQYIIKGPI